MACVSYLKRIRASSSGGFTADSGIAFRVSRFLSARPSSSDEDVETLNVKNRDELKVDGIRRLLDEYGFTPEQVARISKSSPVLSRSVETVRPKLAFLRSILGSNDDVASVVASNPRMLASSLKNQLIPQYNFLKSMLDQEELVAKSIKRSSSILCIGFEDFAAKISFLKEYGVSDASIAKLMERSPGIFAHSFSKLNDTLKKTKHFGFEPSNPMIVSAIRVISQITESKWDRKVELYKKWGWSDDDFRSAFKRQPFIMCLSEEKINKGMDMFLNKTGLSSSDIMRNPNIMYFSLEKRIIPRFLVISLLFSKGVLGNKSKCSTYYGAVMATEEAFVKKFVDKYPEHVRELWLKLQSRAIV